MMGQRNFGQSMKPRRLTSRAAVAHATRSPFSTGTDFRQSFGPRPIESPIRPGAGSGTIGSFNGPTVGGGGPGSYAPGPAPFRSRTGFDVGEGGIGAGSIAPQPRYPNTNDTPLGVHQDSTGIVPRAPYDGTSSGQWSGSADPQHTGGQWGGHYPGSGAWEQQGSVQGPPKPWTGGPVALDEGAGRTYLGFGSDPNSLRNPGANLGALGFQLDAQKAAEAARFAQLAGTQSYEGRYAGAQVPSDLSRLPAQTLTDGSVHPQEGNGGAGAGGYGIDGVIGSRQDAWHPTGDWDFSPNPYSNRWITGNGFGSTAIGQTPADQTPAGSKGRAATQGTPGGAPVPPTTQAPPIGTSTQALTDEDPIPTDEQAGFAAADKAWKNMRSVLNQAGYEISPEGQVYVKNGGAVVGNINEAGFHLPRASEQAAVDEYFAALQEYNAVKPPSRSELQDQASAQDADKQKLFDALSTPIEVPEIDQKVVQGEVDAMRRQLAFEQSKAIRFQSAVGARARLGPDQQLGLTAERTQQQAIAEASQESVIRQRAEIANQQAAIHSLDLQIQNVRLLAGWAHDDASAAEAFAREKELTRIQAALQLDLVKKISEYEQSEAQASKILGIVGTIGGGILGAYFGGPQGASAGASIGGGAGSQIGGLF